MDSDPLQWLHRFARFTRRDRSGLSISCLVVAGTVVHAGIALSASPPAAAGADHRPASGSKAAPEVGDTLPSAEIHFDSVVREGEVPPPDSAYASRLDSAGRRAMQLTGTCRLVRGTLGGDADFEVCLPVEGWNGKLLFWAPGGIGTEFQGGVVIRPVALQQGYAYATTDYGQRLETVSKPESRVVADGRGWAAATTRLAERLVEQHYGQEPRRTYAAGHSYGAYLTTLLLEDHPDLYDGGIRHAGANWMYSVLRAYAIWLRRWDERPVDSLMYDVGARLPDGFEYRLGQERGTEDRWEAAVPVWRSLLSGLLPAIDPSYDPDGNGELSKAEIEAWDANERPDTVAGRMAPAAVTGRLERKMIVFSGLADLFSPPSIDREYRRLVEEKTGPGRVALYLKPGATHNHGFPASLDVTGDPVGFWPEALRALDVWVEEGTRPGTIAGLSPQ